MGSGAYRVRDAFASRRPRPERRPYGNGAEVAPGWSLLSIAKAALVTSGTATLETAIFNVPQVVCYKGSAVSFWIAKHNVYSDRIAEDEYAKRQLAIHPRSGKFPGNPDQRVASQKRIWARLPLFLRPFLYFIYRYIFRAGFLDGKWGFVFHFLQAYWFRLVVDIKIMELQQKGKK